MSLGFEIQTNLTRPISVILPSLHSPSKQFDPAKHYYVVVDFNLSVKHGRECESFSTTTTLKNNPHLSSPLENMFSAYARQTHSLLPVHRNDTLGGGRIELRQGSLTLLVRFIVSKTGEIVEQDTNHSIGQLMYHTGFAKEVNNQFLMNNISCRD